MRQVSSSFCRLGCLLAARWSLSASASLCGLSLLLPSTVQGAGYNNHYSFGARSHTTLAFGTMASSSSSTNRSSSPPLARREEERVIYAGVAPPGWDPSIPRQPDGSKETLLDPPVPVPDPYGWLRDDDRKNEQVLDHLRHENAYTEHVTSHLQELRESLYKELLSGIQETDYTLPRPYKNFWYYTRTFEGSSYPVYCRAPKTSPTLNIAWDGSKESPILDGEQVYLDLNQLAEGKDYCSTGTVDTSDSDKLLAYLVDYSGDEIYDLVVQNLETNEIVLSEENLDMASDLGK